MTQPRELQQFDAAVRNAPIRPREWQRVLDRPDTEAVEVDGGEMALVMQDGQLHLMFAFESNELLQTAFNPMWESLKEKLSGYPVGYLKLDLVAFTVREWLDPMLDMHGFLPFPEWMDLEHRSLSEVVPPEVPAGLSIRRATPADFDRIVEIESESYGEGADGPEATRVRLDAAAWVGVLVEGNSVIGYAINNAPEAPANIGRIASCAIAPEAWGRGLGKVMLTAAAYQQATAGAKQAIVRGRPDVPRSLPTAIATGFRPGRSGFELRRTLDEAAIAERFAQRAHDGVKVRFGGWH
jgi:GNAT superfamily N-acetyltransferase